MSVSGYETIEYSVCIDCRDVVAHVGEELDAAPAPGVGEAVPTRFAEADGFTEWFGAIWAGSDDEPVPEYQSPRWREYLDQRTLARGAWNEAWHQSKKHVKPVDAAVERDATRYRWLRTHFKFANDSTREIWFDGDTLVDEPSELDESIDVAITAQQQENKQ